jgi:hypothetical protein
MTSFDMLLLSHRADIEVAVPVEVCWSVSRPSAHPRVDAVSALKHWSQLPVTK